jgi:hypothetical protein
MAGAIFLCLHLSIFGMLASYADDIIEFFESDFVKVTLVHVEAVKEGHGVLIGEAASAATASIA